MIEILKNVLVSAPSIFLQNVQYTHIHISSRCHEENNYGGRKILFFILTVPVLFEVFPLFWGKLFVFLKNFLFYVGVWLIDKVVIVSDVQQSDSALDVHTSVFFFRFSSHVAYYRVLRRVPSALQLALADYLFLWNSVYMSIPNS